MLLFEIHQRFKGHFLNELRFSFNYEFLNSSIWVQLTCYMSRTKWLTQISYLDSPRSENDNVLAKAFQMKWKIHWLETLCNNIWKKQQNNQGKKIARNL